MAEARLPLYAPRGPSIARATALSGAMTVNLLVLGALLLPAALAPTLQGPRLSTFEPALVVTAVEVAAAVLPLPPAPAPVEAPPRPAPAAVPRVVETPLPTPVVPDVAASTPVAALPPAAPVAAAVPAPGPAAPAATEGALAYVEAPQPDYPRAALKSRAEGTVLLRVRVGSDGLPVSVAIARSSGHPALDDAARRQVLRHWRFQPALRDGVAVEAVGLVPIAFRLDLR
ncbi:MAG: energy transducer TonB [Xanthomonadaceae bacterium]|jgi:protein TonB|nr:energy transducer TonB [Xanthomonadaceae bacterium]